MRSDARPEGSISEGHQTSSHPTGRPRAGSVGHLLAYAPLEHIGVDPHRLVQFFHYSRGGPLLRAVHFGGTCRTTQRIVDISGRDNLCLRQAQL